MNDLSGRNCLGGTYPALQIDRGVLDDWEEAPVALRSWLIRSMTSWIRRSLRFLQNIL